MANTLTNLIPTIYQAADTVGRELTGFIPAVYRNSSAARAAVGESIRYPVVGAFTPADITAGATGPDPSDVTIANDTLSITKSRSVTFYWTGEEQVGLGNAGIYTDILRDQFAQAMRALTNEVESDLGALYVNASRAAGTAGTTPFGTANDYTAAALTRKVLADNGAPLSNLQLVIDTAAGANIRGKQAAADASGTTSILRQGVLLDINGMMVRESAYVKSHTKGTALAATTNAAGYPVGATTITLASAGTGTILAGDVITFAGDANQYVVVSGDADVSNGGTITIAAPGLRQAIPAFATAITVTGNSVRNMAFDKNAIHLITRAPAMPQGGDAADDVTEVTDPHSGLAFQVALYRQRRRVAYEVGLAWGVKVVKPEFVALLLG